ncbi:transcription factor myb23 [Anaeramoeba flamelloides]|uniref:Transcription factor myb23 n=1 Tax=Anaeramoeba flamelloides TaxID=1746091 RepID=A0ABQ8Y999_9EUKA|nr:transcription factor myb23 [Anaeramoeba flamelloides]
MGGHKFGVDQDEILIINVIKRIGWFWGGRAKRVHPKITNSFDNINNNNFFYLHPPSGMNELFKGKFKEFPQNIRVSTQNHPILLITLMIKISSWAGKNFGVDQDEILIINVIKRIGWFWGGRAKLVHPKITNSFDNINNNNLFYLHPLLI